MKVGQKVLEWHAQAAPLWFYSPSSMPSSSSSSCMGSSSPAKFSNSPVSEFHIHLICTLNSAISMPKSFYGRKSDRATDYLICHSFFLIRYRLLCKKKNSIWRTPELFFPPCFNGIVAWSEIKCIYIVYSASLPQWEEDETRPLLFMSEQIVKNSPGYESAQESAHLPLYRPQSLSAASQHLSKRNTKCNLHYDQPHRVKRIF